MSTNLFVWKPKRDHGNNAVAVLPSVFTGRVDKVEYVENNGTVHAGRFRSVANQGRGNWDFASPGARYGAGQIRITLDDGTQVTQAISSGGQRVTQTYDPAKYGGNSSSSNNQQGGSSGGSYPIAGEGSPVSSSQESGSGFPNVTQQPGANIVSSPNGGNLGQMPSQYPYWMIPLPNVDFDQSLQDAYAQGDRNLGIFNESFDAARDRGLELVDTDLQGINRGLDTMLPRAITQGDQDTGTNIRRAGQIDDFNIDRTQRFNEVNRGMFNEAVDGTGMQARERMQGVLSRLEDRAAGGLPADLEENITRSLQNRGSDLLRGSGISSLSGAGARTIDRLQVQERLNLALDADRQLPSVIAGAQQLFTPPTLYAEPTNVPLNAANFGDRIPLGSSISAGGAQQAIASQMTELQAISPTNILSSSLGTQQFNEQSKFNAELAIGDRMQGQMTATDNAIQGLINADKADATRAADYEAYHEGLRIRQDSQNAGALGGVSGIANSLFGPGGLFNSGSSGGGQQGGGTSGGGGQQAGMTPGWNPSTGSGVLDSLGSFWNSVFGSGSSSSTPAPLQSPTGGTYYEPGGPAPGAPIKSASVAGPSASTSTKMAMVGSSGMPVGSSVPAPVGGAAPSIAPQPASSQGVAPKGASAGTIQPSAKPRRLADVVKGMPDTQAGNISISAADMGASLAEVDKFWGGMRFQDSGFSLPDGYTPEILGQGIDPNTGERTYTTSDGRSISRAEMMQNRLEDVGLSGPFEAAVTPIGDAKTDSMVMQSIGQAVGSWGSMSPINQAREAARVGLMAGAARGIFTDQQVEEMGKNTNSLLALGDVGSSVSDKRDAVFTLERSLHKDLPRGADLNNPEMIGDQMVVSQFEREDGEKVFNLANGSQTTLSKTKGATMTQSSIQAAQVIMSNADDEEKLRALAGIGITGSRAQGLISDGQAAGANGVLSLINTGANWDDMNDVQRGVATLNTSNAIMAGAIRAGYAGPGSGSMAAISSGISTFAGAVAGPAAIAMSAPAAYDVIRNVGDLPGSKAPTAGAMGGAMAGAGLGAGIAMTGAFVTSFAAGAGLSVAAAAATGAAAGSAIPVPVVGTLVGLGVGALVGVGIGMTGSGKGTGQMMRDGWRSGAQSGGVLDSDYMVTLADGSKYNMGLDGGAKLTNSGVNIDGNTERHTYDVDWSNPLVSETIPDAHLFAIATGLDPTSNESMDLFNRITAQGLNAATSNAGSVEDVRSNFQSMMQKIDPRQTSQRLDYLRLTNKISEQEYGVYFDRLSRYSGQKLPVPDREQTRQAYISELQNLPQSQRTSQHRDLFMALTDPKKISESESQLQRRIEKEQKKGGK